MNSHPYAGPSVFLAPRFEPELTVGVSETILPSVGELWDCKGRQVLVAGNSVDDDGLLWVHDWPSGEAGRVSVEQLEARSDRHSLKWEQILTMFNSWARVGSSDALWWLAWAYEGTEHRKSTYYYVAALRCNPAEHGWALGRIFADARSALMCEGVLRPRLNYLKDIPEFCTGIIGTDWKAAWRAAQSAVDMPVFKTQTKRFFSLLKAGETLHRAAWIAGVPSSNIHLYPEFRRYEDGRIKRQELHDREQEARHKLFVIGYAEGFIAIDAAVCPYLKYSPEWDGWTEGFDDARWRDYDEEGD